MPIVYFYNTYRWPFHFVRIPKTASSSIIDELGKPDLRSERPLYKINDVKRSFAFVRHPVTRFVSAWGMFNTRLGGLSFEQALRFSVGKGTEDQKVILHFLPLLSDVFSLHTVHKIYKFEDLPDVWEDVKNYIGYKSSHQLPHITEEYKRLRLTNAQEEKVRKRFKKDIKHFGYK